MATAAELREWAELIEAREVAEAAYEDVRFMDVPDRAALRSLGDVLFEARKAERAFGEAAGLRTPTQVQGA